MVKDGWASFHWMVFHLHPVSPSDVSIAD